MNHERLVEYFITVGLEDHSIVPITNDIYTNPIRQLRVVSEKQEVPEDFIRISATITGKDAYLTKKGLMNQVKYYLCYSRENGSTTNHVFTRIALLPLKKLDEKEWTKVDDIIPMKQADHCLAVKHDPSMPPMADLCFISNEAHEKCPDKFMPLPITINGLTLCCRPVPATALDLRYQTCILDRYPFQDYEDNPLSNTVAVFCQPEGAQILTDDNPMPTFLSFVLTDTQGEKMYAVTVTFYEEMGETMVELAKKAVNDAFNDEWKPSWPDKANKFFCTKSVCILSYYPFFRKFRECLKEIYRVARSPGKIPIERFILHLCKEVPLPLPTVREVLVQYAHRPVLFKRPGPTEFELLDVDLERVFGCLSLDNIILIFRALLTQSYKIVFSSNYVSIITEIIESFISFLRPFEWQFTYVPVLPYAVFSILDAPVPVLCGMSSSRLRPEFFLAERETIIVDIDNDKVHIPGSVKLIELPQSLEKKLRLQLIEEAHINVIERYKTSMLQSLDSAFAVQDIMKEEQKVQFNQFACHVAFWAFFVSGIGADYMKHLIYPDDPSSIQGIGDLIRIEDFLKLRKKSHRKFWDTFSQTQSFARFIEDVSFGSSLSDSRKYQLQWFYQCCVHMANEMEDPINTTRQRKTSVTGAEFQKWCAGQQLDKVERFLVPHVNTANIPEDFLKPSRSFPAFDVNLFSEPRRDEEKEIADRKKMKVQVELTNQTYPTSDDFRNRETRGLSVNLKTKSAEEKVKFELLQIYGCWFATRVAALDYANDTDLTPKLTEQRWKSVLDVLYCMNNPIRSHDIPLNPDELIYKSCLVLCGKLKLANEAKKIFRDLKAQGIQPNGPTYAAYTNAMASSGTSTSSSLSGGSQRNSLDPRMGHISLTGHSKQNSRSRSAILPHTSGGARIITATSFDAIQETEELTTEQKPLQVSSQKKNELEKITPNKLDTTLQLSQTLSDNYDNIKTKNRNNSLQILKPTTTTTTTTEIKRKSLDIVNGREEEEKSHTTFSYVKLTPKDSREKNSGKFGRNSEHSLSKKAEEKSMDMDVEMESNQIAILIDYSTLQMDTRQQCACGYILSDAEVMASWPEEYVSTSINCKVCNLNSFIPKIHIKCNATEMSLEKQIYEQVVLDFKVTYLSPLYLRRSMETIANKYRQHLEDSESLRKHHSDEYWNLLWYFVQRKLDFSWLLEDIDYSKLKISPIIDLGLTKFPTNNEELSKQMAVIIDHLKSRHLKLAMIQWLKNRENASTEERGQSIWDISLPDVFFNLGVPSLYDKYEDYVNEFKKASYAIQSMRSDCLSEDRKVIKYEIVFKHMRPVFPRIQQYRISASNNV